MKEAGSSCFLVTTGAEPKRAGPVPLVVRRRRKKVPIRGFSFLLPQNETLTARFREGYIYLRNRERKGGRNYILYSPFQTLCNFLRLG